MSTHPISAMADMGADQRTVFEYQFAKARKSVTAGVLLAIFLGGFGAHHFYLHRTGLGILYFAFCWTLIPAIVALIEALFMRRRVAAHNRTAAGAIAAQVRLLGRAAAVP